MSFVRFRTCRFIQPSLKVQAKYRRKGLVAGLSFLKMRALYGKRRQNVFRIPSSLDPDADAVVFPSAEPCQFLKVGPLPLVGDRPDLYLASSSQHSSFSAVGWEANKPCQSAMVVH